MTLARSRRLKHPFGLEILTPLLVPSFSSKGFGVDSSGVSEIRDVFRIAAEYLTDSMLISAYDLHHEHLPVPESAITEVIFVDSGGYELSDIYDMSAVYVQPVTPGEWTEEFLEQVLNDWPAHVPAIFTSFDHPKLRLPLEEQIDRARRLHANYPDALSVLLIKPETPDQKYVQVPNVIALADKLRGFDIIGVTEKELGNSLLARMKAIAEIRLGLDDASIAAPIHVFGGLDPVVCLLYFVAGAEIFDGLTWLRYGFANGTAIYTQNYGAHHVGLDRKDWYVRARTIQDNIAVLGAMCSDMRVFVLEEDYRVFGRNADLVERGYASLRTRIRRLS